MSREFGPIGSHWIVSLLVLALAGLIGLTLPALQAGPAERQQDTAWTPHSTAADAATDTPVAAAPTESSAAAEIIDAPAGAVLAWQEPAPATPSSVPVSTPLTSATPPAPVATPGVAAPGLNRSPNRLAMALLAEPAPPATGADAAVSTESPITSTAAPIVQPAPPVRKPSAPAATAGAQTPAPRSTRAPTPRPVITAPPDLPTPPPPVAPPPHVLPPALLAPALDARVDGVVQFVWLPTSALPAGALYEVVVWSPEQDPNQAWGIAPPVLTQSLWLNVDDLLRSGRFREGSLYWTVLVVRQDPYQRLTLPGDSERRYLVLATGG